MNPPEASHERAYRRLLRLYPAEFRNRYSDELVQLFSDQLRDARAGGRPAGAARTWLRTLGDLAVTAASEHARRDRSVAHSLATPPSPLARALGLIGILGGAILVAAFIPDLPWEADLFNLRLALFNLGAIAIVLALYRRQASVGRRLALLATVPVILANAWHLFWIVRIVAQPGSPGIGDFPPVYQLATQAMWLTDAVFGLAALWLGVASRWGAFALAIGSILAFGPLNLGDLALAGLAVNGLGWILLGLDVARRGQAARPWALEASG
jgi:hypothetical protein